MFCWNPVRISFILSEHEDGGFGELEAVEQQMLHALGIVDATFELVPRLSV